MNVYTIRYRVHTFIHTLCASILDAIIYGDITLLHNASLCFFLRLTYIKQFPV